MTALRRWRLWLSSIQRTGFDAAGAGVVAPAVQFSSYWSNLDNRPDALDMFVFRVDVIDNGLGGSTYVSYFQPHGCNLSFLAGHWNDWSHYPRDCFVVSSGAAFNKYLVHVVTERDWVGSTVPNGPLSPDVVTTYDYLDVPGWHEDSGPQAVAGYWNEWRGHTLVRISSGSGTVKTVTEHRQFRGLSGSGYPVAAVQVSTSTGQFFDDNAVLRGRTLESATLNAAGTGYLSRSMSEYGFVSATTPVNTWLVPSATATFVGETVRTEVFAMSMGDRTTRTETAWNTSYLVPELVLEQGDLATTADDRCTQTQWVANMSLTVSGVSLFLVKPYVQLLRAANCSGAWQQYSVFFYDGNASWSAPPTKGNLTRTDAYATATSVSTTTIGYDFAGRPVSSTDPLGRTSSSSFEPVTGVLVSTTDAKGYVTRYQQDSAWGVTTRVTDPNNRVSQATYDGLGRTYAYYTPDLSVGGPAAIVHEYNFAAKNTSGVWTTPAQVRTWKLLDIQAGSARFLSSISLIDGLGRTRETHSTSPNAAGRLVAASFYDSRSLPVRSTQPFYFAGLGPLAAWGYKAPLATATSGSPVFAIVDTRSTYDEASRPTANQLWVDGAFRSQTVTAFDGWWTTTTPPVGAAARQELNGLGQVSRVVEFGVTAGDPNSWAATTYGYNTAGNLTSSVDHIGNTTTSAYDWLGRQVQHSDPDAGASVYQYDAVGNLTRRQDAKNQVFHFAYDQLNRPTTTHHTSQTLGNEWSMRTYDSGTNPDGSSRKGLPISSTSWTPRGLYTESVLAYDARGRPTSTRFTLPATDTAVAGNWDFQTTYNYANAVTSSTFPSISGGSVPAETVATTYNSDGTSYSLANGAGVTYVASTAYTALGQIGRRVSDNAGTDKVWRDFYYDDTQRISQIQTLTVPVGTTTYSWKQAAKYTYDNNGNLTSTDDLLSGERECFRYDLRNRLAQAFTSTDAACGSFSGANPNPYWQTFSFDSVGRMTNFRDLSGDHFYSYAAGHPHAPTVAFNTTNLTYDSNGSRTGYTRSGAGAGTFSATWDKANRLESTLAGGQTTTNTYLVSGQRIVRADPDGTLTWYLGGLELRKPVAGSLQWTRYYNIAGTTVAYRTGVNVSDLKWLGGNNQASATISIVNGTTTAVQNRYTPYGKVRGPDNLTTDHGYIGQTEDASTALNYLNNRYQDPTTGTFISVDPLVGQTGQAYLYGGGNPTTLSDPDGLCAGREGARGGCGIDYYGGGNDVGAPGFNQDPGSGRVGQFTGSLYCGQTRQGLYGGSCNSYGGSTAAERQNWRATNAVPSQTAACHQVFCPRFDLPPGPTISNAPRLWLDILEGFDEGSDGGMVGVCGGVGASMLSSVSVQACTVVDSDGVSTILSGALGFNFTTPGGGADVGVIVGNSDAKYMSDWSLCGNASGALGVGSLCGSIRYDAKSDQWAASGAWSFYVGVSISTEVGVGYAYSYSSVQQRVDFPSPVAVLGVAVGWLW